jgi:hypothetical protein
MNYTALDTRKRSNTTVDLMIFSYGVFAAILVRQGFIGKKAPITREELNAAIAELNKANTEQDVFSCTLSKANSIWHRIYINVETGELAFKDQNGKYIKAVSVIGNKYEFVPDSEIGNYRPLMIYSKETPTSYIEDPYTKTSSSDINPNNLDFNACFLYFWAYLHGSRSVPERARETVNMYTRELVNRYVSFFRSQPSNQNSTGFHRFFGVKEDGIEPIGDSILQIQFAGLGEKATENRAKASAIANSAIMKGYFKPEVCEISEESTILSTILINLKKPFSITLTVFLIITPLSNIFAWADIIAISAMMTKVIISGIGSAIGIGCLIGTIVLCCRNKIRESYHNIELKSEDTKIEEDTIEHNCEQYDYSDLCGW